MMLKGKCLQYHNDLIRSIIINEPIFFSKTFYSSMSDTIDNLLFFFLNDEVSASLDNRGPLGDIIDCEDFPLYKLVNSDVEKLFQERTDFIIGSYFLDFTVSSFSVFEKWICNMYEELRPRKPSKGKKAKRLEKLIEQYYQTSSPSEKSLILEKIMVGCSAYVSSSEKIEFCMSRLTNDYKRDVKKDKKIINLYRNQRNTIHNLGVHKNKSIEPISIKGIDMDLKEGLPSFTEDRNSHIYICDELVEIYRAMCQDFSHSNINSNAFFQQN